MGLSYIATNPPGQRWVVEYTSLKQLKPTDTASGYRQVPTSNAKTGLEYAKYKGENIPPGEPGSLYIIIDGEIKTRPTAFWVEEPGTKIKEKDYKNLIETDKKNTTENTSITQENNNITEQNNNLKNLRNNVVAIAQNTTGGDYVTQREFIRKLTNDKDLENSFKIFYKNEKLTSWDPSNTAKPPSPGGLKTLDIAFYKTQVPAAAEEWKQAVKDDNIDITERYNNSEDDFYGAHYTNQGKLNGIRGYAEEATDQATNYVEKPTDTEKQQIKDTALGQGATFDTLIAKVLGVKEQEDTKKYGALAQNVLKDTIAELNKAKAQENAMDLYRGLEGFSEIMDLNKTLANSILGDSGLGGYLAMTKNKSEADVTSDFEKQLGKMTGLQSNTTYNWQKWFDDTLTQKYGIDYKEYQSTEDTLDVINTALKSDPNKIFDNKNKKFTDEFVKKAGFNSSEELTKFLGDQGATGAGLLTDLQAGKIGEPDQIQKLTSLRTSLEQQVTDLDAKKNKDLTLTYKGTDGVPEEVKVEASFARQFIDDYLKPRFNYSKSMNEFIDYMNVKEEDKNIFQTTDRLTEVKDYAQTVAKLMQADLDTNFNKEFNTDFYFNPKDSYATQKQELYGTQQSIVNKDWENAKTNPDALINPSLPYLGTWAENAYAYKKDLNNKDDFARLHYQIIGSQKGFDAAIDPASTLQKTLESPVYSKAQSIGTVFGDFVKPEEFADKILKGVDPLADKESWNKILKQYNLSETASLDDIKKAISTSLTTGTAEEIRANIKSLQELEKTPTQAELGVSYIERPEDKTASATAKSDFYNVFKKAGYQGTEESFYNDYMPDSSPEDIKLLTDITKGKMPELDLSFDTSDPMAALGKLEDLNEPTPIIKTKKPDSYFDLNLDDEEDTSSTSPTSFLSDFTALLKK